MQVNGDQQYEMKSMAEVMVEDAPGEKVPDNLLHCFQVTTWDFGIDREILQGRRLNFVFCIKQKNDGKINSHKWFFQAIRKYLKPQFTCMLDIGTRPDDYAIQKMYNYMVANPRAGGVSGEV